MATWDDFFVAEVGASAALGGLLFVGISINMSKILAFASLPFMAMRALILLVSILIVASVLLIPGQLVWWLWIGLATVGVIVCVITSWASIASLHRSAKEYRSGAIFMTAIVMGTTILYPVTGFVVLLIGPVGVYVRVPVILLAFVVAIFDSWVLTAEINQ
jgi:hypothetical protein